MCDRPGISTTSQLSQPLQRKVDSFSVQVLNLTYQFLIALKRFEGEEFIDLRAIKKRVLIKHGWFFVSQRLKNSFSQTFYGGYH